MGSDLEGRKKIRKNLVDFYGAASKIVHGAGTVKKKDVELLNCASNLCRRGILKVINSGSRPNWMELLLGRGIEAG